MKILLTAILIFALSGSSIAQIEFDAADIEARLRSGEIVSALTRAYQNQEQAIPLIRKLAFDGSIEPMKRSMIISAFSHISSINGDERSTECNDLLMPLALNEQDGYIFSAAATGLINKHLTSSQREAILAKVEAGLLTGSSEMPRVAVLAKQLRARDLSTEKVSQLLKQIRKTIANLVPISHSATCNLLEKLRKVSKSEVESMLNSLMTESLHSVNHAQIVWYCMSEAERRSNSSYKNALKSWIASQKYDGACLIALSLDLGPTVLEGLILHLESDDLETRKYGAKTIREYFDQSYNYDPKSSAANRQLAIKKWKAIDVAEWRRARDRANFILK